MKYLFIIFCNLFLIISSFALEKEAATEKFHFKYLDTLRPYCPTIDYTATGENDQQRKNNFCMAMMDNMKFGECGVEQRHQAFKDKGCHVDNMQFNTVHFAQYGTPMYRAKFMVRSVFGNGEFHPIYIQGITKTEYLMNLRRELLNEEIRFEMGMKQRKEMFFKHFPDETFNCVIY